MSNPTTRNYLSVLLIPLLMCLTSFGFGQTYVVDHNLDNSTTNLYTCVEPACNPGGNAAGPSAVSSVVVSATPCGAPSDGKALFLSATGPDYANALWSYKLPGMSGATHFQLTFDACFDSSINYTIGQFEADIALFVAGSPGTNYMFGGQCDLADGFYDVWDQSNPKWIQTTVPCNATILQSGRWHHFQRVVHFDSGKHLWFDYLCINSSCYKESVLGEYSAGSLPAGWGSTRIWQFQLNLNSSGGTANVWLNNINGIAWQ